MADMAGALLALGFLLSAAAAWFAEPVVPMLGWGRFGTLLAASGLYAVPVWMATALGVQAYADFSENPERPASVRQVLAWSFNGFRFLPALVFFGAGLPYAFAAGFLD